MRFFGKDTPIKSRAAGAWIDGRWSEGAMTPSTVNATIMPASTQDYDKAVQTLGGRIPRVVRKMYADVELKVAGQELFNGDLVAYMGEDHVIVAGAHRNLLGGDVSHWRYLLVPIRELVGDATNEPG